MKNDRIIYIIYKMFLDKNGECDKVDMIEADKSDKTTHSYTKLYNLQIPKDMKNKVQYDQIAVQIMDDRSEKSKDWF